MSGVICMGGLVAAIDGEARQPLGARQEMRGTAAASGGGMALVGHGSHSWAGHGSHSWAGHGSL